MACRAIVYLTTGNSITIDSPLEIEEMQSLFVEAMENKYKYVSFSRTNAFDMIMVDKIVNVKVTLY